MRKRIDDAMKKIKLYQEEAKLVVMIMGAITSVTIFVSKLLNNGFKAAEHTRHLRHTAERAASAAADSSNELVATVLNNTPTSLTAELSKNLGTYIFGILSIGLISLVAYLIYSMIKKRKRQ